MQFRRREQSTSRCGQVDNLNEEKSELSSKEQYLFSTLTAGSIPSPKKLSKFQVKVSGSLLTLIPDTGASVNILDEFSYEKLKQSLNYLKQMRRYSRMVQVCHCPLLVNASVK